MPPLSPPTNQEVEGAVGDLFPGGLRVLSVRVEEGNRAQERAEGRALREQLDSRAHREQLDSRAFREQLDSRAFREQLDSRAHREQLDSRAHREQLDSRAHREQGPGLIKTPEPRVLSSLSHTGGWICLIAAEVLGEPAWVGLGLDVEFSHRRVKPGLKERISRGNSAKEGGLSAIELWVIKEACYKANPRNQNTVIAQYQVLEVGKDGHGHAHCTGQAGMRFPFKIVNLREYNLAVAKALIVENSPPYSSA